MEFFDREEVYNMAYKKLVDFGPSCVLSSPRMIKGRRILKESMISYFEETEEFEKCAYVVNFFDTVEKEISINNIVEGLKNQR